MSFISGMATEGRSNNATFGHFYGTLCFLALAVRIINMLVWIQV
jgi:hypothetical protein